jgi:two-component system nitrogen regulation response regulator NtrX
MTTMTPSRPQAVEFDVVHDLFASHLSSIRQIMSLVDAAAAARDHVAIIGEPGAGHEMVARVIHARGGNAASPFAAIDCSKLRGQALELQLFGVPAQGANGSGPGPSLEPLTRASRLVQARGGTLLIEHPAQMSARVQARLLRVLTRREAVLVPEQERIALDVRIVVAGDAEFELAREDGRLSPELHAALSRVRIPLPVLRMRQAEVPALAAHLLEDICRSARVPTKTLTSLAQILLGAVTRATALELRLVLEDLVMRVPDRVIRVEDVLGNVLVEGIIGPLVTTTSLRDARTRFERQYITAVLERHRGRIPHAARSLGIQRTNLYRKLRRLDVAPDSVRPRAKAGRPAR